MKSCDQPELNSTSSVITIVCKGGRGFHSRFSGDLRWTSWICRGSAASTAAQKHSNSLTVHVALSTLPHTESEVCPGTELLLNWRGGVADHRVVVRWRAVTLEAHVQHRIIQNRLFTFAHGLLRQSYDAQRSPSQRLETLQCLHVV